MVCTIVEPIAHSAGLDAAAPEAALEAAVRALLPVAAGLVRAVRTLPLPIALHAHGEAAALGQAGEVRLGAAPVAVVGLVLGLVPGWAF